MKVQRFFIPGKLPGLNEYTKKNRANRYQGNSEKKGAQNRVIAAARAYGIRKIHKAVYMRYRWVESDRRRDKDNIAFAKKFIQDALVNIEILPDDNWAWVAGFEDTFEVNRNPEQVGVWVEIEEMEG